MTDDTTESLSFGAEALLDCSECKSKQMFLVRRMPYKRDPAFERQQFFCEDCGHVVERIVDKSGRGRQ
jgi:DNA-directed RNA polymerase subunit RPC12/RpoP